MQIVEHIILICRRFHIQENNAFKDKEISDSFLFLLELDSLSAASLCTQNHNLSKNLCMYLFHKNFIIYNNRIFLGSTGQKISAH